MTSDFMNAVETAEYLCLNAQTVRRLAKSGKIPAFKVGKSWRFNREILDRWAEEGSEVGKGVELEQYSTGDIIVVDDEPMILSLIRRTLADMNIQVKTYTSGDEALAEMKMKPQMLFLDLKMPGMSGPQILKEVNDRWGSVPAVIVTGYPDSSLMEAALNFSPVTLLAKPFRPDQLRECAMKMSVAYEE